MKTVRWGILGCGDVTEIKSGPGFQTATGSELVAVMRRTGHLAEDYARRHEVPRWYDRAEALIHDPAVDAVYIATPPGSHAELALAVAAAGKAAYVEKPMARNHAECRLMIDAFATAGVPLFVAYYRRALPRFAKVRELLASGCIGRATSISYRYADPRPAGGSGADPWRLDPKQSGGGLFLDLGSHALDLFDFLFGPLGDLAGAAARASPDQGVVEDIVTLSFRTESGLLGTASWNFAGKGPHEDQVDILGEEARLSFAVFGNEPIRLITPSGAEERFEAKNPRTIQEPMIQRVVATLRGEGTCPSTGESAARTSLVMDRALEAYYGGRDDAFWERAPGDVPPRAR